MKSRLTMNIIANIASFSISLLVSMWMTPFIIHSLGAEAYGFIPLTQQLINYMTVITIAINGMVARFFTFAVKSGNKELAQDYFNTSLISSTLLSIFIIVPLLLIIVFVKSIINVPENLIFDVRISLAVYGGIFILSSIGASFSMALFCENRLDISGILGSFNTILRSICIIALLYILKPRLWLVSIGSLIAAAVIFFQNIYYFKKLLPDISINRKRFDLKKMKELLSSGIWSSINYIGAVLFLQIDMLVANWSLGAKGAGEYTAVLQLSNLLRGLVATITVVFGPMMVELYARKKIKELIEYSNKSVKITGIIIALPVGLACGLGGIILTLWLGEGFRSYTLLFSLMTIHLSVNLSVQPLFGIFQAANKVKVPALVTLAMGIVNFAFAILFSITLKMGAFGIVISSMLVLTAKNLIFTPIYSSAITGQPLKTYYKGIIMPAVGVGFVMMLSYSLQGLIHINSWVELFAASATITLIYGGFVYLVMFNNQDRQRMKRMIYKKLNAFL